MGEIQAMLARVSDSVLDRTGGCPARVTVHRRIDDPESCVGDDLLESVASCQLDAPLRLCKCPVRSVPDASETGIDRVPELRLGRPVLGHAERPGFPLASLREIGVPLVEERHDSVGVDELWARRHLFEESDRPETDPSALLAPAGAPENGRETREARAFPRSIAELAVAGGSRAQGVEGFLRLVGQVAAVGVPPEQTGAELGATSLRIAERTSVLRCGLAMRPHVRRSHGGFLSEAKDSLGFLCLVGMVRESREVRGRSGVRFEGGQRPTVERDASIRRE